MKKYKIRKKRKVVSVKMLVLILIIILFSISIGYSRFSTLLTIRGAVIGKKHEPDLEAEIVPPPGGGTAGGHDRLSTNTSFSAGLLNFNYLSVKEDVFEEPNTIITKLKNENLTIFKDTATCTFTLSIQNNSGYTWRNGTYTVEKNNVSNYCAYKSSSLSKTTVENGETVTLTMVIDFTDTRRRITAGQYFMTKFAFECNGITRYYNYKVIIEN